MKANYDSIGALVVGLAEFFCQHPPDWNYRDVGIYQDVRTRELGLRFEDNIFAIGFSSLKEGKAEFPQLFDRFSHGSDQLARTLAYIFNEIGRCYIDMDDVFMVYDVEGYFKRAFVETVREHFAFLYDSYGRFTALKEESAKISKRIDEEIKLTHEPIKTVMQPMAAEIGPEIPDKGFLSLTGDEIRDIWSQFEPIYEDDGMIMNP